MKGNPIYSTCQSMCRVAATLMCDLKVYGARHIPRRGGVLVVSNHQSFLDPMCIGCQLPRPMSYFAKSELFENRYFGRLLRNLYAFPVRQGQGDIAAVREAIRRLQEGHALVIFPEGSRSSDGELLPIEPGVGLIARKGGVPVVPCVVEGSFNAWPRSKPLPRSRPVRVRFEAPMHLAEMKPHAIVKVIEQTMRRMQRELRKEMRVLSAEC
jgi:1-acyl-sn-glycerol-3-phosphate acyltransferase